MPELTTAARAVPYDTPSRCSRDTITGAAQKTFCVNVPAQAHGSSATTSAMSKRSGFLRNPAWMPAALNPCALVTPPPSMNAMLSIIVVSCAPSVWNGLRFSQGDIMHPNMHVCVNSYEIFLVFLNLFHI